MERREAQDQCGGSGRGGGADRLHRQFRTAVEIVGPVCPIRMDRTRRNDAANAIACGGRTDRRQGCGCGSDIVFLIGFAVGAVRKMKGDVAPFQRCRQYIGIREVGHDTNRLARPIRCGTAADADNLMSGIAKGLCDVSACQACDTCDRYCCHVPAVAMHPQGGNASRGPCGIMPISS